MNDQYESDDSISSGCGDCEVLMEALRDAEQQCREAEDKRAQIAATFPVKTVEQLFDDEREYSVKMDKLEHRRNCALEVLLKHQRLEHL